MKFSTLLLAPLFAASYVAAHGGTRRVSIQGKVFEGNGIGGPTNPSVIRQISSQDPNKGANNPAITCGPNSGPAALVADINPGDTIAFDWRTASDGKWPHNTGPQLTYMASCGSVTCDKFNQANAQWFKIDQAGRKPGSGEWFQNDLFNGGTASVRIPQNIAPGNYLIRHEIIALHLATARGGAEFYAGCVQLRVGGNGNGVPQASDLVRIPGAYSDDDPGIFAPQVYNKDAPYIFPGPPIATFITGSGSPSSSPSSVPSSSPDPSSLPSVSTDAPQPSPSSSKPHSCRKKKNPSSSAPDPTRTLIAAGEGAGDSTPTPTPTSGTGYTDYRPRRLGHVMRRMAFENSFH